MNDALIWTVIGVLIAGFGTFWKIIQSSKDDVLKEIRNVDSKVEFRHQENIRVSETKTLMLESVKNQVLEKPNFDYIDKYYARKDVTALELKAINEKLDQLIKR